MTRDPDPAPARGMLEAGVRVRLGDLLTEDTAEAGAEVEVTGAAVATAAAARTGGEKFINEQDLPGMFTR